MTSPPVASVVTPVLVHYVDPDDIDRYWTVCRRGIFDDMVTPVVPATCLWCAAGRIYSTDVGF